MKHADLSADVPPDAETEPGATPHARRPYQPPAIEETSQFETLALACGQNYGGGTSCSGSDPYDPGDDNYKFS